MDMRWRDGNWFCQEKSLKYKAKMSKNAANMSLHSMPDLHCIICSDPVFTSLVMFFFILTIVQLLDLVL